MESNKDNNHVVEPNKKISSVEWLFETLLKRGFKYKVDETIAQAKAMHKEEIINTYKHGIKAGIGVAIDIEKGNDFSDLTPDEFYQQTYGEN